MNVKKNYIFLCIAYFLIYFSNAFFMAFFQIFLLSKGFNESKIGIISSITPLLCIIANPIYSLIGKNNKKIKILLFILCLLEAIAILLFYEINQFTLLILVMCLVAMVDPPLFVILDSYASSFVKEHNKNYSYIRMIGTLSYAIGTFVAGLLIKISGYGLVFYSASFIMILSMIFVLLLKGTTNNEERQKGDFSLLLKDKSFIIFGIYFVFMLAFQLLGDTYISMYLTSEKGVDESTFGIINAAWVVIELVVIIILNKFKIKNSKMLLIIMGICYLLRFVAIGLEASLFIVIIFALLRGISMAVYVCLYIPLISKHIKQSNVSMALLLIAMLKSLLSTIMIFASGFLIEKIGYSYCFIIWSILCFIVILGYSLLSKKYPLKEA